MTGRQHMAIAFSVSCFTNNPIIIGGALIGALLPDIDAHTSTISNLIPIQKLTGGLFMKHRGGVHSLFASIIVTCVFSLIFGDTFGRGIMIGYLSHILSDMTTHRGVTLLYPFNKKRIKLFNLTSQQALAFVMMFCVLCVYLWLKMIGLIE